MLRALDEDELRERARRAADVEAVAVCLLWGFRHPDHERRVAELALEALDGVHVSTSHETAGVFREYERCATTIVDAALSPLLRRYLERLAERAARRGPARARDDAVERRRGRRRDRRAARLVDRAVGPGGRRGRRARVPRAAGAADAVGARHGRHVVRRVAWRSAAAWRSTGGREVGGRALALPMVDVHTVGAGGGSIAWRDAGGALRVGPALGGRRPRPGLLRPRRRRSRP